MVPGLRLAAALVCSIFVLGGCVRHPGVAPVADGQVASDRARVAGALDRLTAPLHGRAVRFCVSGSDAVAAYAWPDGRLLFTRGLVRLLDDEELAAAAAHELGHLLVDGHVRAAAAPVGALGGGISGPDVESRADAAGVRLMERAGYPRDAMARMLEKVARVEGTPAGTRERVMARAGRFKAWTPRGSDVR